MASIFETESASIRVPARGTDAQSPIQAVDAYTFAVAPIINDVVKMVKLAAGHKITRARLLSTDLDTNGTPLVTIDAGFYNTATDAVGVELASASTIGQAGTEVEVSLASLQAIAVDNENDRILAFKIKAAPATGAVGTVTMEIDSRPQ